MPVSEKMREAVGDLMTIEKQLKQSQDEIWAVIEGLTKELSDKDTQDLMNDLVNEGDKK